MNTKMASKKTIYAYSFAYLLGGVAGSIYYTYRSPYIYSLLGEEKGRELISIIIASEQLPGILGFLTGALADVVGRRRVLYLSLASPLLFVTIGLVDPFKIPVITFTLSLMGIITGPAGAGVLMVITERSGRRYSLVVMMSSIGWAVGGLLPYVIVKSYGSLLLFVTVTVLHLISSILVVTFYPREADQPKPNRGLNVTPILNHVFRRVCFLILSATIANAALSFFYSVTSVRIYSDIEKTYGDKGLLIYGVALSTLTALAGAIVRPIGGMLVDRFNPLNVLTASLLSYLALDTGIFIVGGGIVALILWILPVYPFRDTATTIALARRVEIEYQSSLSGLSSALNTLSGLLVILLTAVSRGDFTLVYLTHIALLLVSLTLVTIDQRSPRVLEKNLKRRLSIKPF